LHGKAPRRAGPAKELSIFYSLYPNASKPEIVLEFHIDKRVNMLSITPVGIMSSKSNICQSGLCADGQQSMWHRVTCCFGVVGANF
jgi:hypothetical protein